MNPRRLRSLYLVRFCDACKKSVHYCRTLKQLKDAIVKNYCVAVEINISKPKRSKGVSASPTTLVGDPLPF
jgi:hypothetical protein